LVGVERSAKLRRDRRAANLVSTHADDRATARPAPRPSQREALALVARLPVRQRAAVTLKVAGHSYAEIADRLRMTHRTVECQLMHGRAGSATPTATRWPPSTGPERSGTCADRRHARRSALPRRRGLPAADAAAAPFRV
jgi:DNA-binding CsgD family transcriptional regulator